MKDWKWASESGCWERIWTSKIRHWWVTVVCETYDSVEVRLHKFLVEVHLVEVPIWSENDVHVIKTSDLSIVTISQSALRSERKQEDVQSLWATKGTSIAYRAQLFVARTRDRIVVDRQLH